MVPLIIDSGYGVTVISHPPHVSDVNDTAHKVVHQVMSSKPSGELVCPQVHPLASQVEYDPELGGFVAGGHTKEVSPAMGRCDIDTIHEPFAIENSVEGVNINTHENQECNNTQGVMMVKILPPV